MFEDEGRGARDPILVRLHFLSLIVVFATSGQGGNRSLARVLSIIATSTQRVPMSRSTRKKDRRKGTATIELAVCLPLLVTIVFGSIQTCRWVHMRESLHVAAYEAGRAVTRQDVTAQEGERRAMELLRARGVENATVQFVPPKVDVLPSGTEIWISITAPISKHANYAYGNQKISVTATFVKE